MDLLIVIIIIFIAFSKGSVQQATEQKPAFINTYSVEVANQIPIGNNDAGIHEQRAFFKIYDDYKIKGRII